MSAKNLLRTGLALGARIAPKLQTTSPVGAFLTAAAFYIAVKRRTPRLAR